jgi:NAD(P)-dependent dehydrogenase (short-subunit alcohol dehydrogenase family)
MLEGKTCFITGGAQGIGLGIARACADRGAKVAIADINAELLETAKARLSEVADVRAYRLDVADRDAVAEVAIEVESDLGPVYALFNNAGVADSVSPSKMRGEVWDWMLGVNLQGVYNGVQAFLPSMLQRGEGGYIVNTSSVAGLVTGGSGFAYHSSKYAVVGLSESLREELAHHNISVSVICPGQVATSIVINTSGLRPANAEARTQRASTILDLSHQSLLANGIPAEEAGRIVVDAALAGLPYIFTDNSWGPAIEERTSRILESMSLCFPGQQAPSAVRRPVEVMEG